MNSVRPEQAVVCASDWVTLHVEQLKALAQQRQDALISRCLLLVVDRVHFADTRPHHTATSM